MSWIVFVLFIIVGLLFIASGWKRPSHLRLFFGSMALVIPVIYLSGIQVWLMLLPLAPAIALAVSYLLIHKRKTA